MKISIYLLLILFYVMNPFHTNLVLAKSDQSLKVDPGFSVENLRSKESKDWYNKVLSYINDPKRNNNNETAAMGDINTLGRNLNSYLTSILTLFRLTGDKALLTEVDRIMELERAKLSDCEYHYKNVAEANPDGTPVDKRECTKDGFLNLIRRPKNNEGADLQFIGNDHHEMDEILSHSIIAEVAYALFLNQDIGAFGEHAKNWIDYLTKHYEPKTRKRHPNLDPKQFVTFTLMHADTNFLRYNYYMHKITGEDWRLAEFKRDSNLLRSNMRLINLPQGQAGVVWDHAWQGPHGHECQAVSTNYASYTILALNDLWLEGLELFGDNSLKRRVSNTINYLVLNEYDVVKKTYPSNICGDNQAMADQANLVLGDKPKTNTSKLVTLNLFELGRWGGLNNYLKTALSLVKKANPQYVQTSSGIAFLYLSRDELEGTAEFSAESHERLPAAESRARVRLNKPTQ